MGTFKFASPPDGPEFVAKGASLSDLFETAAAALFSLAYDRSSVGFEGELNVVGEAPDLQSLLTAWLEELWNLYSEREFVPGDFIVVEVGNPDVPRFGPAVMTVRGAVRGRAKGDWFKPLKAGLQVVALEVVQLGTKRRSFEATVRVKTSNAS